MADVHALRMDSSLERIERWARRRRERKAMDRFGGIQWCPWCRQCAQLSEGWHFREWDRDQFLDVLTCGHCEGTSLWRFEMGMIYIGPLEPPKPKAVPAPYYDIPNAALSTPTTGEASAPPPLSEGE